MKRLVSLLLATAMLFMLAIPSFAVKAAKFSMKPVSETDNEIVLSIDYEGGSTFNCIDFEINYNEKKLKPTEAYDGDGLEAFIRDLKKQGGAGASAINKDSKPIKGSMAVTSMFKVVNGKDLFVIKFKKLAKDKVSTDDVEIVFTNCASESEKVKASVSNQLGGGTAGSSTSVVSKPSASTKKEVVSSVNKPDENSKTETTATNENSETKTPAEEQTSVNTERVTADTNHGVPDIEEKTVVQKPDNAKKTIGITAVALCIILVIVAVCVYISKKKAK